MIIDGIAFRIVRYMTRKRPNTTTNGRKEMKNTI